MIGQIVKITFDIRGGKDEVAYCLATSDKTGKDAIEDIKEQVSTYAKDLEEEVGAVGNKFDLTHQELGGFFSRSSDQNPYKNQ